MSSTAPIDSTTTSQTRASTKSPVQAMRGDSVATARTPRTTAAVAYCTVVPQSSGMPSPCRLCQSVPAVPPASASRQAATPPALSPLRPTARLGVRTSTTPATPRASPSHCRRRSRSPSSQTASAATSTGCRLTTTADTPAGVPREIAQNTPPR
ncbi:MAG: hypothetical protein JWN57_2667 [Frankiales bacterium]|nr:hypothetical protein [Frankiales bacterium]